MKKRLHLIKQHDEKDCGAACLSMLLQCNGKKVPLAAVREAIQVDQYGASMYGVLDGAEKFGLSGQAFEGTADAFINSVTSGEIPLPAIARIINREIYEHYVIVSKVARGNIIIFDPDMGKRKMSYDEFSDSFLGQIMVFEPGSQFTPENLRKGSLTKFLRMISHQKALIAVIGLLSLFITGIGLAGTFLFQYLIDNVLTGIDQVESVESVMNDFAAILLCVGMLYFFKMAIQMLRGMLLTAMTKRIDLPLMLGYYDHVVDLPMRFFDTRKTGEILSRFNDASKIRDAISSVTLTLMIDVVMVTVCGIVLYHQSRVLFFIAMVMFLLYLMVTIVYVKPLDTLNRDLMEQNAQFDSYLKETVDGMETVKSFRTGDTVKKKVDTLLRKFLDRNNRGAMLSLSKASIIECITSVGTLVLLWAGAMGVIYGNMTIGTVVTFYSLLGYFLEPVQNLVEMQSSLQTAVVAADRLNDVLDLPVELSLPEPNANHIGDISFKNVSFRYGYRDTVLDDISFTVKKGQKIALVGESGCGKSTVAKLMMGLYKPESGMVCIDRIPTDQISLDWIRSHTAFVPQQTFLFSDTIRNNILLGMEESRIPTDEEIWEILDACCCEFIHAMPFGLDSVLEENGINLSGGQRQRLAIARALIRKPDLLILDEATSSLDTISERKIQQALQRFCPDMTIIMVAHRLSTVVQCDNILVIAHGKILEQGSHSNLLQMNQYYAELWNEQNGVA
ncbi:peptidase domain-containing ABC transporter [Frisingicoccus sp.]|uniref:peptidase domain-containing ABC transporter n=1 Tax=Frisingicoccus sp. TaxID=1918627 RepID=UPI0025BAD0F0|nr:peptidase domain-containing ABC transporter [Frisingicoccus sp.]